VTVDAAGCQRDVAAEVVDRGGRHVLAVKANQPTLHARVKALLDEAILDRFDGMSHGRCQTTDGGHGRVEVRRAWVTDEVRWLGAGLLGQWPGLAAVAAVECERSVAGRAPSVGQRYFITSVPGTDAAAVLAAVRGHWAVENRLHWQLDVGFREDARVLPATCSRAGPWALGFLFEGAWCRSSGFPSMRSISRRRPWCGSRSLAESTAPSIGHSRQRGGALLRPACSG
jgi:predicted transposase YbfD/YdcC